MAQKRKLAPARTPEARESQMVSLAMDLAEEQLRNGTASSQVITHFLKLETVRESLEKAKLEKEIELLKAKASAIEASKNVELQMSEVLDAMKRYTGHFDEYRDEYDD